MRFRRAETVEAEQWFPGSRIEGVQGTDPTKLCGCVTYGNPYNQVPHVHPNILKMVLVNHGDWVFRTDSGWTCLSDELFRRDYEPVLDWCGELMRVVALLDRTIGFHLWESPAKEDVIREYLIWRTKS